MKHLDTYSNNQRTSTQALLQEIYAAMAQGETEFEVDASGQHDIGGPLWDASGRPLRFSVRNPGQRVGSMGMPGTEIVVDGPAPADVGWLNAGAKIVVRGDGGDTTGHCMADGIIYVGGRAGARSGSLMKHDPAFAPPQLWVLRNTGSFSFEFMGGGLAVVCGVDCDGPDSVIGDRPCVGMVGGTVYARGPLAGLPGNVRLVEQLTPEDWDFLRRGLPDFLAAIGRSELLDSLLAPAGWRKIVARTQAEARASQRLPLRDFRRSSWMEGGLFGDVVSDPGTVASLVATAANRAYLPVWNNAAFAAPCQHACPSGIPTQERINLLRKGKLREALELVLQYSPFPGSVCGLACPNPCMNACTRQHIDFSVLIGPLGKYSSELPAPQAAPRTGKKFAVVGSGVGGLSAAWQLALKGHEVTIYERADTLGGKMTRAIPGERLSREVVQTEIRRILSLGVKVEYNYRVTREKFERLRRNCDGVVVAVGAQQPRLLDFPGSEKAVAALDYLTSANAGQPCVDVEGRRVVVVGAGDVGMDVCSVAWQRGAAAVTAVDIREPASSSRERQAAMALGTQVLWPRTVDSFAGGRLVFAGGDSLAADVVILSIGEIPESEWLPDDLVRVRDAWLAVDERGQTADPKIYAVGDVVRPGLLTEAIGQGRLAALALDAQAMGRPCEPPRRQPIPIERLKLIYFTPRQKQLPTDPMTEAERCISCGTCRDCNICVYICGQNAITRHELSNAAFEYRVDDEQCIGCGFCAAACPSGIWTMVPNQQYVGESV